MLLRRFCWSLRWTHATRGCSRCSRCIPRVIMTCGALTVSLLHLLTSAPTHLHPAGGNTKCCHSGSNNKLSGCLNKLLVCSSENNPTPRCVRRPAGVFVLFNGKIARLSGADDESQRGLGCCWLVMKRCIMGEATLSASRLTSVNSEWLRSVRRSKAAKILKRLVGSSRNVSETLRFNSHLWFFHQIFWIFCCQKIRSDVFILIIMMRCMLQIIMLAHSPPRPPPSHISVPALPRPLTLRLQPAAAAALGPLRPEKQQTTTMLTYEDLMVILQGGTLGAGPRRKQRDKRRVLGGSI